MKTLLLDQATWDLTKDASGNIAVANAPYAIAQDVASAARLFLGELWYDTTKGVPYLQQILGQRPPPEFIKAQLVNAASTVPGVVEAVAYITRFEGREITGQILITDANGQELVVGFPAFQGPVPWYINAALRY